MRTTIRNAALLFSILCIPSPSTPAQSKGGIPDPGIGQACTSFCLDNNGFAVYGTNFDYVKDRHDGLVFVNKRNTLKSFPQPDSLSEHVGWTSKYGSVSFNLIASQTPWAGMNEAGLVISLMRLEESKCPEPDQRPWIQTHYWMQYVLDNCSTIQEVLATDSIRTVGSARVPHYMVCDRYGNCATIEFLRGKMVSHTGTNLPLKVLANTSYDGSLMEWHSYLRTEGAGRPVSTKGTSSRVRFIRAAQGVTAFKPTDSETAVRTAFDILEDASGQKTGAVPPCWSIVFDTQKLHVHFRTIVHTNIRTVDFQKIDFSCQTPATMNDINERLSGDISDQLKDFSSDAHLDHAVKAGKKWGLGMNRDELRALFKSYEKWPCLSRDDHAGE